MINQRRSEYKGIQVEALLFLFLCQLLWSQPISESLQVIRTHHRDCRTSLPCRHRCYSWVLLFDLLHPSPVGEVGGKLELLIFSMFHVISKDWNFTGWFSSREYAWKRGVRKKFVLASTDCVLIKGSCSWWANRLTIKRRGLTDL